MTDYYCGINRIPKGKRRGTAKECYNSKQVRYYGMEVIPNDVLEAVREIPVEQELIKLQLKLRRLAEKGKALQREMAKMNIIINEPSAKKGQVSAAKRRQVEIRKTGKNLANKLRAVNADIVKMNEIKARKDAVLALEELKRRQDTLVDIKDLEKIGRAVSKKARKNMKKTLKSKLLN